MLLPCVANKNKKFTLCRGVYFYPSPCLLPHQRQQARARESQGGGSALKAEESSSKIGKVVCLVSLVERSDQENWVARRLLTAVTEWQQRRRRHRQHERNRRGSGGLAATGNSGRQAGLPHIFPLSLPTSISTPVSLTLSPFDSSPASLSFPPRTSLLQNHTSIPACDCLWETS